MTGKSLRKAVQGIRLRLLRPLRMKAATRMRAKSRGVFIGITGSSGKSTTTALIAAILRPHGRVQAQILDNTISPLVKTLMRSRDADYVVAELGVGGKGQMIEMAPLLRPDVAVVTLIGLEHYSAFRSRDAIAAEKGDLVASLSPSGLAVLNCDDPHVMGMAARTTARVVTFGRAETADCRILSVSGGFPQGVTVTLGWRGQVLDFPTTFVGPHFAVPVNAAICVALELGVPVPAIRASVAAFATLWLSLSVHHIPDGPIFVADCKKAPRGTLSLAFDTLRDVAAPRRRVVLGTISDDPGKRRTIYREAVRDALAVADEVITVSDFGGRAWATDEDIAAGRYRNFTTPRQAADYIAQTAIKDEVILLKGSSNLHLERILLQFRSTVRCWEPDCGRTDSCLSCGLFEHEHTTHRTLRKAIRRRRVLQRLSGKPEDPPALSPPR